MANKISTNAGVVQPEEHPFQTGDGGSIPARQLHFRIGETKDARGLVLRYHYSRRWNGNVALVGTFHADGGLFGDCGNCVAACVYGIPSSSWGEPVLELVRLIRTPERKVPLTRLISLTTAVARRRQMADLVVSYADRTQGHEGYVYRAACWNYHGMRSIRKDGIIVDGTFMPDRNARHIWGTNTISKLRNMGIMAEPHHDLGKHLYWKALSKDGEKKAERLGLKDVKWK